MDKLAIEYGDGLYELANEDGVLEELRVECAALRKIILENPGYISLITSRKLERSEKEELIRDGFEGKLHPYLYNFIRLMNDRGVFPWICQCLYRFEERYLTEHRIGKVTVYYASMPDEAERSAISQGIEKKIGKKAEIEWKHDPALLAGIRAEADGLLIEYSVRQRIEDLKRHLNASVTM